ncbi:glycosyltransferase family 2 protein [Flavivirga jejuensis]|uniref:Glycosyltransferase family A protein n=1 Tax=Flavivirga jejuensis TaxID=870487 RepID=A0ABT8WTY9_9FLAO|nr:glycosyltransferase family A protein [Flavivirga jejuensis]MDO5976648.1 glycosyltransferase family A protein [Flavivirga jejuensis]
MVYHSFSLIVCTYMRSEALLNLLNSVKIQSLYPNEILIVDGSTNNETKLLLDKNNFDNLKYFRVEDADRGLTKQRNYGINLVSSTSDIVCFLDDDTVLVPDYFENILNTYKSYPEALGVGGYIINETNFEFVGDNYRPKIEEFYFDGWKRKDSKRFVLRKKFGLDCDCPPGVSPLFSHARSVSFLPPSNKVYEVELLMGGVSSFKKDVFKKHQFSTFFEGYGLYEDADFSIRVAKTGKLYLNTAAKVYHYHEESGRPDKYKYGKMVVKNGYYIWRTKNPKPTLKTKIKWHVITVLLIIIRFTNTFTTSKKKEAFSEALGRTVGWLKVLIS